MDKVATSLSLMRRLPPNKIEQNLNGLLNLVPDETDEILQRVDQPLQEVMDTKQNRKFLLCDYNRDGDSYRSPWSNSYFPPISDGFLPSEKLRALEVDANELFDAYRELYYEGGTSSVYLWDLEGGFAGCFLVKKNVDNDRSVKEGCWDAIHVVEVEEHSPKRATYKLTTTIMLHMAVEKPEIGDTLLSGSLTRQHELIDIEVDETKTHLANIGRLIEDLESDMRSHLDALYILKTREVVNAIRSTGADPQLSQLHVNSLKQAVLGHGKTRTKDSEF